MRLLIENQLTHAQYEFNNLVDAMTSRLFYDFVIMLPEGIDEGIYQYKLYDDENVKATGLLQVGNFVPEKQEYKKEQSGYIQYQG